MKTPVILLHGLGRTRRTMAGLDRHLRAAGHTPWRCTYPSTRRSIEACADFVAEQLEASLGDASKGPLHAVTHSMGGVVLRHLADRFDWARVVMIGPPSTGSVVARRLGPRWWFKWCYGPAGQAIGDGSAWPAPDPEWGVIAGTRGLSWTNPTSWVCRLTGIIERTTPSDGTVTLSEATGAAPKEVAHVHADHTGLLRHPKTRALTSEYLRTGTFNSLLD